MTLLLDEAVIIREFRIVVVEPAMPTKLMTDELVDDCRVTLELLNTSVGQRIAATLEREVIEHSENVSVPPADTKLFKSIVGDVLATGLLNRQLANECESRAMDTNAKLSVDDELVSVQ